MAAKPNPKRRTVLMLAVSAALLLILGVLGLLLHRTGQQVERTQQQVRILQQAQGLQARLPACPGTAILAQEGGLTAWGQSREQQPGTAVNGYMSANHRALLEVTDGVSLPRALDFYQRHLQKASGIGEGGTFTTTQMPHTFQTPAALPAAAAFPPEDVRWVLTHHTNPYGYVQVAGAIYDMPADGGRAEVAQPAAEPQEGRRRFISIFAAIYCVPRGAFPPQAELLKAAGE